MFICEAAASSRLPHTPPTHFPVSSPTESSAFNTAASRFIAQAQWISPFSGYNKTHHWKRCSNYLWLAIIRPPLEQLHPRTKSLQTKTQSAIKTVNVKERKGGLWYYSLIPADWSNLQQQQMLHAGRAINRAGLQLGVSQFLDHDWTISYWKLGDCCTYLSLLAFKHPGNLCIQKLSAGYIRFSYEETVIISVSSVNPLLEWTPSVCRVT